jgi:ectoine hydroxylase-related dioxygenase (phytanoyl-CoA dioxygenase family)
MAPKNKFYGNIRPTEVHDEMERCVEEVKAVGYSVLGKIVPESELKKYRSKIDEIYRKQEEELGRDYLNEINELHIARALLAYDDYFLRLVTHESALRIIEKILGDYFIINLQNAIISFPGQEHHQSAWHRDLPYQNFVISHPIALNVFYCIDEFSEETGGTQLVPFTHRMDSIPSEEYINNHKVMLHCPAGSVVIFDSMLLHKAGYNSSSIIRRGVNHIFSVPIMKQQYDFPAMLKGKYSDDPRLNRLLGYDSQVPASVVEWRKNRHAKFQLRKQK